RRRTSRHPLQGPVRQETGYADNKTQDNIPDLERTKPKPRRHLPWRLSPGPGDGKEPRATKNPTRRSVKLQINGTPARFSAPTPHQLTSPTTSGAAEPKAVGYAAHMQLVISQRLAVYQRLSRLQGLEGQASACPIRS